MKFQDFDDVSKEYGIGGGWMQLQEGDNEIRIVSEFEDFGTHWDNKKKKGTICLGKDDCELCQKKDKPKVQFIGWVIDRKDKQIKLLRIGYQIFKQLGQFARSKEYSFESIPPYDINVKREGTGLNTTYTVIPARKNKELTEEEKEAIIKVIRPPKDIIKSMKAKIDTSLAELEEEEIDNEEIPF